MNDTLFIPKITLPPEETEYLILQYGRAKVILEYGSGGSTLIGAESENIEILISVESDKDWSEQLSKTFDNLYPQKNIKMVYVDIGPTKRWGYPVEKMPDEQFLSYPQSIWDQDFFEHPDLILIDGRFRVGCFYTAMLKISRPVTVLWDDYLNRKAYHEVEKYIKPKEFIGRMARFELEPNMISDEDFNRLLPSILLPR